jgi:hypothetical protein
MDDLEQHHKAALGSSFREGLPLKRAEHVGHAAWGLVSVVVEDIANCTALHLFDSCNVLLAGRIPDCGRILQDWSNHGPVRRCLDGGSALAEVAPHKAYSFVALVDGGLDVLGPGQVV